MKRSNRTKEIRLTPIELLDLKYKGRLTEKRRKELSIEQERVKKEILVHIMKHFGTNAEKRSNDLLIRYDGINIGDYSDDLHLFFKYGRGMRIKRENETVMVKFLNFRPGLALFSGEWIVDVSAVTLMLVEYKTSINEQDELIYCFIELVKVVVLEELIHSFGKYTHLDITQQKMYEITWKVYGKQRSIKEIYKIEGE